MATMIEASAMNLVFPDIVRGFVFISAPVSMTVAWKIETDTPH